MLKLKLIYNNLTGTYILNPYTDSRQEFDNFEQVKDYFLQPRFKKRKIKLETNFKKEGKGKELSILEEILKKAIIK